MKVCNGVNSTNIKNVQLPNVHVHVEPHEYYDVYILSVTTVHVHVVIHLLQYMYLIHIQMLSIFFSVCLERTLSMCSCYFR